MEVNKFMVEFRVKTIKEAFPFILNRILIFGKRVDIKIDGKIIKRILEDKAIHSLVKTIVSFAKDTNIKVVAEHVDSKEIYDEIKNLGIDYSQGYYFSSPKEII